MSSSGCRASDFHRYRPSTCDRRSPISPDALFWSGESYRMGGATSEAFRRYNNCRWNHPSSEAAKFARGRLALPEMLQQFESEANAIENQ